MGQKDPSYVPPFSVGGGTINSMDRFKKMTEKADAASRPAVKKAEPPKPAAPAKTEESSMSIDALIRAMHDTTERARKLTGK